MPKYKDISKFPRSVYEFPRSVYEIDVPWAYLNEFLKDHINNYNLNLDPDFQRTHVWSRKQQISYIEYQLKGGEVGRNLIFNCPNWQSVKNNEGPYEIIDGKQRLEAVSSYLKDAFKVFGYYHSEYEDKLSISEFGFRWRIMSVNNRSDILKIYLNINSGGTPHTKKELDKVRNMLKKLEGDKNI